MHLANAFIQVTYIEAILFIQFRVFSIYCLFQLNVWHCNYIDMYIKKQ